RSSGTRVPPEPPLGSQLLPELTEHAHGLKRIAIARELVANVQHRRFETEQERVHSLERDGLPDIHSDRFTNASAIE
ncbi:hypothetical protein AB1285_22950, partial [Microbacterium sp. NRRL B-14842]|uniref:hypothetical protein n=1 Tax=Microbacterium sp. NRRL B-14842 TaxID=3162881 RepID=UPI003D2B2965